jgi:hypothetical protein
MSLIKSILGIFKSEYVPEQGEQVLKVFRDVWVDKGTMRGVMKHILVVTNKRLVMSGNTFGGFPGFNFEFESIPVKNTLSNLNSTIQSVNLQEGTVEIVTQGAFNKIVLKDKDRAEEIYNLIKSQLKSQVA